MLPCRGGLCQDSQMRMTVCFFGTGISEYISNGYCDGLISNRCYHHGNPIGCSETGSYFFAFFLPFLAPPPALVCPNSTDHLCLYGTDKENKSPLCQPLPGGKPFFLRCVLLFPFMQCVPFSVIGLQMCILTALFLRASVALRRIALLATCS